MVKRRPREWQKMQTARYKGVVGRARWRADKVAAQISTFPVYSSKCLDQISHDSFHPCGETNYVAITLQ